MKRVLSGIKPSGKLHIGNYIGSLSQWEKAQEIYESIFPIVDLHAITVDTDPKELRENIYSLAAWYVATGINPNKSIIFIQSKNKDHAQLAWVLNCNTKMGELSRMTQFKSLAKNDKSVSAGLFDYPVLMAADILLYDTDLVPVGEDQKQHLELARDIAQRFNSKYKPVFKLPRYMPPPVGERIMSLQHPDKKMSKSVSDTLGTIYMDDGRDEIRKKIFAAVTDSENRVAVDEIKKPAITNLVKIYMAFSGKGAETIADRYSGKGYKKFKEDLSELIISRLEPMQKKYTDIRGSNEVENILKQGLVKALEISNKKMEEVERAVGLG